MLISVRWLDELLTGPGDAPLDGDAVAETLTSLGLEVEGVSRFSGFPRVVIGEVREVSPHPKADRLNVVTLFDGDETVQVVCGATNLPPAGGKVVFARVGAVLPGDFEIGARELRGVSSSGMICSEAELEIGPDGDGIMVLPQTWTPGERLDAAVPEIIDTVIEISVTPNRPDALGHLGVAADLAVKLGRTLRLPQGMDAATLEQVPQNDGLVELASNARAACGRYLGFALEGLKVGPSPMGTRVRLHRVGLRPINNVVDVTNLVLMEYGQPQHAFDMDQLAESRVLVRMASPGEPMVTLDGTEIELRGEDLVIADGEKPQALAGVMGGEHSMVSETTSRGLLEVAWFRPTAVRATARHHGFHTDSSHRFERQVDDGDRLEGAARRALQLLADQAGARVVGRAEALGERPEPAQIELRATKITGLLGFAIEDGEVERVLQGLGVDVSRDGEFEGGARWRCVAPSGRPDLTREVDLIEEVMRHHGLEDMPSAPAMPTGYGDAAERAPVYAAADRLVDALVERGLHEHIGFAFTGPEAFDALRGAVSKDAAVRVSNPMRSQHSLMRAHLLPGLLDAAALNASHHARDVALFELGRVYDWHGRYEGRAETRDVDVRLPRERMRVAVLRNGHEKDASAAARQLGADLSHALARLGHAARVRPVEAGARDEALHPGVQACLETHDGASWTTCGVFGEVHPEVAANWDLPEGRGRPVYGELWIERVPAPSVIQDVALPRFPASSRDLSVEIDVAFPVSAVTDALVASATSHAAQAAADAPRLAAGDESAHAIDVLEDYRGKGVDAGRRAVLLRLSYRADGRTLKDKEVQALHETIVEEALRQLEADGASVRRR